MRPGLGSKPEVRLTQSINENNTSQYTIVHVMVTPSIGTLHATQQTPSAGTYQQLFQTHLHFS